MNSAYREASERAEDFVAANPGMNVIVNHGGVTCFGDSNGGIKFMNSLHEKALAKLRNMWKRQIFLRDAYIPGKEHANAHVYAVIKLELTQYIKQRNSGEVKNYGADNEYAAN